MSDKVSKFPAKAKIGFLASGRGSNMQAVIEACHSGQLNAEPVVAISDRATAQALDKAKSLAVPGVFIDPNPSLVEFDRQMASTLVEHKVDLVVLVGYVKKIGPETLGQYSGRMINIHPALLPKFGGKGMYGLNVHRAVLEAGEKQTGATVHLVEKDYDTGAVLAQVVVDVMPGDTPESLSQRVLVEEYKLLVDTLAKFLRGEF